MGAGPGFLQFLGPAGGTCGEQAGRRHRSPVPTWTPRRPPITSCVRASKILESLTCHLGTPAPLKDQGGAWGVALLRSSLLAALPARGAPRCLWRPEGRPGASSLLCKWPGGALGASGRSPPQGPRSLWVGCRQRGSQIPATAPSAQHHSAPRQARPGRGTASGLSSSSRGWGQQQPCLWV